MSGKEIDRNRAKSAWEVAKQHPGLVLFVASPALVVVVLVGFLAGTGWALLLLLVMLGAGGAALVRKRS